MVRTCSTYGGDRSKISHVRPYFASMHASLMRCEFFLLDARPASPDRRPPSRPRFARAHETRGLIADSGLLTQWEFSCWSF